MAMVIDYRDTCEVKHTQIPPILLIKLILFSGLTLFFDREVLVGHLLDEPVRFLFSPSQTPHLFNQNEAEIVLGVFGGSDDVDGEAMFASRGENVDSAGLH